MHSQINFIKFVESNKFDNVYSKIGNIFIWSNFQKTGFVLIDQISLMKNIQSELFNHHIRKKFKKTTNEWTWNLSVANINFGALASLIFMVYLVISFTSTNNLSKHLGFILK